MDEIDSIGSARMKSGSGNGDSEVQRTMLELANVIFLDAPTSGFSYAKSPETYKNSDTLSAKYTYQFLSKWLEKHFKFISNPLYITGLSYSGITIPLIVQEIFNGNEAGNEPKMNISCQDASQGSPP
ncbi:hypothetical protein POM88_029350 [Heracleum sosnowskyi]|uniref:Serine carboxypeptidase n=1 Tax=Heracleum sosnowskyi TaxID=360622 RepID=A0AAD8MHN3_9APIA|nr:hypothetical protein POM88_029350 [Heracleum sosnowskyi]